MAQPNVTPRAAVPDWKRHLRQAKNSPRRKRQAAALKLVLDAVTEKLAADAAQCRQGVRKTSPGRPRSVIRCKCGNGISERLYEETGDRRCAACRKVPRVRFCPDCLDTGTETQLGYKKKFCPEHAEARHKARHRNSSRRYYADNAAKWQGYHSARKAKQARRAA
jgi:hypothetical protein